MFYKGAEVLLFPPAWVGRANRIADELDSAPRRRQAKAIGIDPAQGGDKTAMAAVDEFGLIELLAKRTPDTSVITSEAIAFGRRHRVPPCDWVFDAGGGGKQHADRLREQGYDCRVVAFGQTVAPPPSRIPALYEQRVTRTEDRVTYKNKRAEMYGTLRWWLDPAETRPPGWAWKKAFGGWGIPAKYADLLFQMSKIPLTYDPEGVLYLIPKDKVDPESKKPTLVELIGRSPDELDAVVLALYGMTHPAEELVAGAF